MSGGPPEGHRALWDPGAQPERTYEAWTRTALALCGCSLLATRLAGSAGAAALVLAVGGSVAALAISRVQRRRLRAGRITPAPRAVAGLTALTVLLALAALALVGLGPRS